MVDADVDLNALVVVVVHSHSDLAAQSAEIYSRQGLATVLSCTSNYEFKTQVSGEILRIPNVGYGSAVNAAVMHFRSKGREDPEWIIVSNDDLEVSNNAVKEMKRILFALPPSVVAVGFDAARSWTVGSGELSLKGSFFAVRWDEFIKCDGFDPRFFLYFEDTDLFERLRKNGELALVPIAGISHSGAGSTGKTVRAGFQIVISAIEFRKVHPVNIREIAKWLLLTLGSSLVSRRWAHSLGLVVGCGVGLFPAIHRSLSEHWFGAATLDQRKEFRVR